MKVATAVAAGFAAGLAFVVACHHTTSAHAGPADCATWQVAEFDTPFSSSMECTSPVTGASACAVLPSGWEPMVFNNSSNGASIVARRCAP
jgi:uncharacterized membrane protein